MKPAQIMPGTVAMCPDTGPQPLYLGNQARAIHPVKIIVHAIFLPLNMVPAHQRRG